MIAVIVSVAVAGVILLGFLGYCVLAVFRLWRESGMWD